MTLKLNLGMREAWALVGAIQAKERECNSNGEAFPVELNWVGNRIMGLIKEKAEEFNEESPVEAKESR